MRTLLKMALAVALLVVVANPVRAEDAEKIDNPEYVNWKKFKAGTWIKVENTSKAAGHETKMVTTTTLKSLTAEKAVLTSQMTMSVAGQEITQPPTEREVPAKIDKPKMPEDGEKPDVKTETGEETLTVDGKAVACKWVKSTVTQGANTTVSKIWNSEAMPGTLVKMESATTGAMKIETTMKVTKFELKTE